MHTFIWCSPTAEQPHTRVHFVQIMNGMFSHVYNNDFHSFKVCILLVASTAYVYRIFHHYQPTCFCFLFNLVTNHIYNKFKFNSFDIHIKRVRASILIRKYFLFTHAVRWNRYPFYDQHIKFVSFSCWSLLLTSHLIWFHP